MAMAQVKHFNQPTLFSNAHQADSHRLPKQKILLRKCIRNGTDFENALQGAGLTYDDLRYEFDERLKDTSRLYRCLSDFQVKPNGIPAISFFSGAGGADLGFEAAGFEHLALVEINRIFCDTIRLNRPKWHTIGPPEHPGDISREDQISDEIRRVIGSSRPFDGVFIGGPPCQPFSIAANQRFNKSGENFKRIGYAHATNGNLLFHYIALIELFRPRAFLIENVPGLLDIDGGAQLRVAIKSLMSVGYRIEPPIVLNAANYQVPQQRFRLFVVGSRSGKAFQMPPIANGIIPCSSVFSMAFDGLKNHETRKHKAESVSRYMKLGYGERDHLGRVDRLNPHLPSKTVIAGGTAGGGRSHLHPRIPRTLSVREDARLQTFPDDYVFTGPIARQFTQVGNAVPPILAAHLADAIKKSFWGRGN